MSGCSRSPWGAQGCLAGEAVPPGTSSPVGGETESLCSFRKPTGGEGWRREGWSWESRERHMGRSLHREKAAFLSPPKPEPEFCLLRDLHTTSPTTFFPHPHPVPSPSQVLPFVRGAGVGHVPGPWHMAHESFTKLAN